MTLFRWVLGLPVAALITAGLFFMMAELIKNKGVELAPDTPAPDLKITADPPPEDPKPIKPPRPVPADEQPETVIKETTRGEKPKHGPGLPQVDPGPKELEGADIPTSGPSIRIAPPYPEGCRSKGAEGVVVVQFDVTPEGDVVNPRIIQSPNRCFDRPVRNAVSKWKYPPTTQGGRAVMRYGMVETFNFHLTD